MANIAGYTNTIGPFWTDNTTGKKLTFDVSGLTADRVMVFNDAAGLIAVFSGNNLLATADGTSVLGTSAKRWGSLVLSVVAGTVAWDDGAGNANFLGYTNAVGPKFYDVTVNFTQTHNLQSLTADRTVTWPDAAGTVTLRGNTATGSGSVVLATAPTLSNPVVGTQTIGDSSTKAASTAFVARTQGDPQFFIPVTTGTVAPTATGEAIAAFINPAGTIALMTLTLPTGTQMGQTLTATFTQIVTGLTVTATNVDVKGKAAPTAAAVGDTFGWVWDSISTKWNRFL